MKFINETNFLKQPKGIQEIFINWWKPEIGDLYFDDTYTTVSKIRIITKQTEDDYDLMYLKTQSVVPLLTEGQLRKFIEDKTDRYIEARKSKGECYKIWLHSKHSNDCIFYNKLGQDLIQAYWKIACKIAKKEMHNKCFLTNCNNCKFIKKEIYQNGKTKCKCLKYNKEVFYRGNNPHFKHDYIYPCEACRGNDFIKINSEKVKNRYTLVNFKQTNENNYETDIYKIWLTPEWNQLTIARKDNMPVESWYDMWNIKNNIWGEECLAIEIYPQKSSLIDGQNQRHLFKIKTDKHIDFSNASKFQLL